MENENILSFKAGRAAGHGEYDFKTLLGEELDFISGEPIDDSHDYDSEMADSLEEVLEVDYFDEFRPVEMAPVVDLELTVMHLKVIRENLRKMNFLNQEIIDFYTR